MMIVQNYYHRILANLDDSGFGIILEDHPRHYIPPHWHEAVELLLFVRGNVTCNFSEVTLRAHPGDIYLINSHDVHQTHCSRNAVYLCVHILSSRMCKFVPNFDQLSFSLMHDSEDPEKAAAYEELRQHMQEILRLTQENPPAAKLECQSRLFAAAALLVKNFSQPLAVEETKIQRSDMTRLEPILEYTQVHHGEELSLDGAANAIGLNKEYFCRLFKKNMGVSYLQYLNQVRAAAVCRDLETSDDPISAIGERHGFSNPKMLNQYFRELYGCTPSEKRKAFREMTAENMV